jgi:hypothetical protein
MTTIIKRLMREIPFAKALLVILVLKERMKQNKITINFLKNRINKSLIKIL